MSSDLDDVWQEALPVAVSIRRVGRIAHELLNDPMTTHREFRDLSRRITRLQQLLACERSNPLYRWTERLKAQVERQLDRSDCLAVAVGS